eukprot:tig00020592_g11674.t2
MVAGPDGNAYKAPPSCLRVTPTRPLFHGNQHLMVRPQQRRRHSVPALSPKADRAHSPARAAPLGRPRPAPHLSWTQLACAGFAAPLRRSPAAAAPRPRFDRAPAPPAAAPLGRPRPAPHLSWTQLACAAAPLGRPRPAPHLSWTQLACAGSPPRYAAPLPPAAPRPRFDRAPAPPAAAPLGRPRPAPHLPSTQLAFAGFAAPLRRSPAARRPAPQFDRAPAPPAAAPLGRPRPAPHLPSTQLACAGFAAPLRRSPAAAAPRPDLIAPRPRPQQRRWAARGPPRTSCGFSSPAPASPLGRPRPAPHLSWIQLAFAGSAAGPPAARPAPLVDPARLRAAPLGRPRPAPHLPSTQLAFAGRAARVRRPGVTPPPCRPPPRAPDLIAPRPRPQQRRWAARGPPRTCRRPSSPAPAAPLGRPRPAPHLSWTQLACAAAPLGRPRPAPHLPSTLLACTGSAAGPPAAGPAPAVDPARLRGQRRWAARGPPRTSRGPSSPAPAAPLGRPRPAPHHLGAPSLAGRERCARILRTRRGGGQRAAGPLVLCRRLCAAPGPGRGARAGGRGTITCWPRALRPHSSDPPRRRAAGGRPARSLQAPLRRAGAGARRQGGRAGAPSLAGRERRARILRTRRGGGRRAAGPLVPCRRPCAAPGPGRGASAGRRGTITCWWGPCGHHHLLAASAAPAFFGPAGAAGGGRPARSSPAGAPAPRGAGARRQRGRAEVPSLAGGARAGTITCWPRAPPPHAPHPPGGGRPAAGPLVPCRRPCAAPGPGRGARAGGLGYHHLLVGPVRAPSLAGAAAPGLGAGAGREPSAALLSLRSQVVAASRRRRLGSNGGPFLARSALRNAPDATRPVPNPYLARPPPWGPIIGRGGGEAVVR